MYCQKCGALLHENDTFCSNCGYPVDGMKVGAHIPYQNEENMIDKLLKKINTEVIVWLIVAVIQIVAGIIIARIRTDWPRSIIEISKKYGTYEQDVRNAISPVCLVWIMAVINIVYAVKNFIYANRIKKNPAGIVETYWPALGLIILLVCNLLFGCVIGITGSIFGFLTRKFVLKHKTEFLQME